MTSREPEPRRARTPSGDRSSSLKAAWQGACAVLAEPGSESGWLAANLGRRWPGFDAAFAAWAGSDLAKPPDLDRGQRDRDPANRYSISSLPAVIRRAIDDLPIALLGRSAPAMPTYAVEGRFRGWFYAGPTLEMALAALQRDHRECLVQHNGPSDAQLLCGGVLVKTEMGANGALGIAKAWARVEPKPMEIPKKHWQM